MNNVFIVLLVQVLLGGFDNLWHHEITEKLPSKPSALHELAMHSVRELIYGVIFVGLAWFEWHGYFAYMLAGLLFVELIVTLIDFIIEDKTRKLPAFERVLHTLLAINIGIFFAVLFPIVSGWAAQASEMVYVTYGLWSWCYSLFGLGVFIWGIRDAIAVMKLRILKIPLWQRKPVSHSVKENPKTYLITGGTGFIGTALVRALIMRGDKIIVLTRDLAKAKYQFGPQVRVIEALDEISDYEKIDTIINLAGEALAGGLWTKTRKKSFFDSRINITRSIFRLGERLIQKPQLLINASAIGYYGNRGDKELQENSAPETDFMSDLCQKWEVEARKLEQLGINVVRLRIGLVLGRTGGIFVPFALSAQLFGAMILGSGEQWMSWISLNDLIRMILFIDDQKVQSTVINATAPKAVRQSEFIKKLASSLHRPVLFRAPGFILRFILRDMADLFLNGQKVLPNKAEKLGFNFAHENIDEAFKSILES